MEPETHQSESNNQDLYFVHISIHGLIRGNDLELGRDADTGGQCKYALEVVRALAKHPDVGQVDLLTRLVNDPKVSSDYAQPYEDLGDGAAIKRINAGPRRYLRKEVLWRYLDVFIDQALANFRETGRLPDIIHAHYADAGYVGRQLSMLLGCPFVFTGHSLGRTKLNSLLASGAERDRINQVYNLNTRIEAEELALDAASLVCTSTQQEVDDQYSLYDLYKPEHMRVIPPGVDVSRFSPPSAKEIPEEVRSKIERFLDDPDKPAVLAIARADEKKNLSTLVHAFGRSETLRKDSNLILIAGNRDRIADLNPGARKVWSELLRLIDDYDLHGHVAIPKHHLPDEIPAMYRYAASKKGVFVNPAHTEPFGLTVIEAAASGLPVLATNDGGPRDILGNCKNGVLIDPNDIGALTTKLEDAVTNREQWERWSADGLAGVHEHYTWEGHVNHYIQEVSGLIDEITSPHLITEKVRTSLSLQDRIIFTGLESELIDGDAESIAEVKKIVEDNVARFGFGIVTGRSLEEAKALVKKHGLPKPDVYITQLGGEIFYSARLVPDASWERHLSFRWSPDEIHEAMGQLPGLTLQEEEGHQHHFKISYVYEDGVAPSRSDIQKHLRELGLQTKVMLSENKWLDVIPLRSGKGQSVRYVAMRWGIAPERVLFYGRRGSDYGALSGQYLAVVGADHADELEASKKLPRVYSAKSSNFSGLLEGIRAYQFDGDIKIPRSAHGDHPEEETNEAVLQPDMTAHLGEEE